MSKTLKTLLAGILAAVIVVAIGASVYTAFAAPGTNIFTAQSQVGSANGNGNGGNADGNGTGTSVNHLKTYTSVLLTRTDETYQPQYLSIEQYQAMLSRTNSGQGNGGKP